MRNLLSSAVYLGAVIVLTLIYSHAGFAQGCQVTGATPGGGEVVVCEGNENNGLETTNQSDDVTIEVGSSITAAVTGIIETLEGDDNVRMNGGTVFGPVNSDCIELGPGNSEFHMLGGSLLCEEHGVRSEDSSTIKVIIDDGVITASDECIDPKDGNDEIYLNGGVLTCGNAIVQSSEGNDTVIVTGGRYTQTNPSDEGIETGDDDDLISISNAIVDGSNAEERHAVDGGDQDDTVKLGTGARILGLSTGGDGFDTLVFEMRVPEESISTTCDEILSMNPGEGEIFINGLFYEWEDFEVLVCDLQPLNMIRPIPTLSEWGLIALAMALGILGIVVYQRRKAAV